MIDVWSYVGFQASRPGAGGRDAGAMSRPGGVVRGGGASSDSYQEQVEKAREPSRHSVAATDLEGGQYRAATTDRSGFREMVG